MPTVKLDDRPGRTRLVTWLPVVTRVLFVTIATALAEAEAGDADRFQSSLDTSRSAGSKSFDLSDSGHRGIAGECGQQRAMRPAQIQS